MVIEDYAGEGVETWQGTRRGTNLNHFNGRLFFPVAENKIRIGDVVKVNGKVYPICDIAHNPVFTYLKGENGETVYTFKKRRKAIAYKDLPTIQG